MKHAPIFAVLAVSACLPAADGPPEVTIPEAARGSWGLVAGDCIPGASDAKGLLVIDATTLTFYESRGTLTAVSERSDTRIAGSFAFTGEGQAWTREEILDVQDDGRTLIRREDGDGAAPGPFRYKACD
jgi:hypothetical protein